MGKGKLRVAPANWDEEVYNYDGVPGEHLIVAANDGEREFIRAYWDGSDPAAILAGQPVAISYDTGATGYNPLVMQPATLAIYRYIAVATVAITAAGWYWFQIRGLCEALVDGTTDVGAGDYLEVINAGTAFVVDHATIRSAVSVASAIDARTADSAALSTVFLIGDMAQVAAS